MLVKGLPRGVFHAAVFLLVGLVLVDLGFTLFGKVSVLNQLWRIAHDDIYNDSWGIMNIVHDWLKANPRRDLYLEHFFCGYRCQAQYPVSSQLVYLIPDMLGKQDPTHLFNRLGLLFWLLMALGCGMIAVELARQAEWRPGDRRAHLALAILAVLSCITFYPALKAVTNGQAQSWLNCWLVLAGYAWLRDRRMLAGMLIGAICVFKPQLSLFLIWGLLRRQWSFARGWLIVMIPAQLASLYLYGIDNIFGYLRILRFLSLHGEIYAPNQSIAGLLNRLMGNGVGVATWALDYPPYNPIVYYGALANFVFFNGLGLILGVRHKKITIVDLLIAALCFTMASPIAWQHHYGFLPLLFIVATFRLWVQPWPRGEALGLGAALMLAHLLTAHYLPHSLLPTTGWASLVQSYVLYGAALLLVVAIVQSRAEEAAGQRRTPLF